MTLTEAIDRAIAETGVQRYRFLALEHPDPAVREKYSRWLLEGRPAYPSLATQAGNAIGAASRFVASGLAVAEAAERDRRLAICRACPEFDAGQGRCKICGCYMSFKARLLSERCPLPQPLW